MDSINISAKNPFRIPEWRWRRAKAIIDGEALPTTRKRDGLTGFKWINRAVVFLREYNELQEDDVALAALAERRPDIFWAYWIWSNTQDPKKSSIEARILAKSDDITIGNKCGTAPSVIEAYEALFFNVREKLQHKSYILHSVIGPDIQAGLSDADYDILWKLYGYYLGPYIVDALESKFSNAAWCENPDGVGNAVLEDAITTLKLKAAMAAKTISVNSYTQLPLLDQFTKFIEIERNSDDVSNGQNQLLASIDNMLTSLPFSVGGPAVADNSQHLHINNFQHTNAELTFEEEVNSALGQEIPNKEMLQNMKFPEAESKE